MVNYHSNTTRMSYGNWVTKYAALRGIGPGELELMLETKPIIVRALSLPWSTNNIRRIKFNIVASQYYVVKNFKEGFTHEGNVPLIRMPVYRYYMIGIGVEIKDEFKKKLCR